jgi:hypothetical protein
MIKKAKRRQLAVVFWLSLFQLRIRIGGITILFFISTLPVLVGDNSLLILPLKILKKIAQQQCITDKDQPQKTYAEPRQS